MQWLRAVEAGANGHTAAIKDLGQVVGMDQVAREGDQASALAGVAWAKDTSVREHLGELADHPLDHECLVRMDLVAAELVEQVAGGGEGHGARCVGGAGLKSLGSRRKVGVAQAHAMDHVATSFDRRHLGEEVGAGPEPTASEEAAHLVGAEGVEVCAGRRN